MNARKSDGSRHCVGRESGMGETCSRGVTGLPGRRRIGRDEGLYSLDYGEGNSCAGTKAPQQLVVLGDFKSELPLGHSGCLEMRFDFAEDLFSRAHSEIMGQIYPTYKSIFTPERIGYRGGRFTPL